MNWLSPHVLTVPLQVTAKIRYRAPEVPATVVPLSSSEGEELGVKVALGQPLRDITPGQAVVFYQDEVCLGGGIILMYNERMPDECAR